MPSLNGIETTRSQGAATIKSKAKVKAVTMKKVKIPSTRRTTTKIPTCEARIAKAHLPPMTKPSATTVTKLITTRVIVSLRESKKQRSIKRIERRKVTKTKLTSQPSQT